MAWPRSTRSAFTKQMQAEDAMRRLAMAALTQWTPMVADAVLSTDNTLVAAGPPSPDAMFATRAAWYAVMDSLYLTGTGVLYSYEMVQALAALGIELPEASDDAVPERTYMATHPDVDAEANFIEAVNIVAASLGVESAALLAVAASASVRPYQAAYLASVRNRMSDIPDTMFRELTRELDEALVKGEGIDVMRNRVATALNIDANSVRAERIARTESAGAMTKAVIDAAVSTGESELEKTWVATMDKRTRKSHYRADGQRVPVGSKFKVGRADMDHPGDPRGPADEVVNCRCAVFILRSDEPDPGEKGRQSITEGDLNAEIERRAENGEVRSRDESPGRVASATKEDNAMPMFRTWTSVLAEIGTETDDGRMLAADIDLTFRDFPLPLMWQKQSEPGHYSSFAVGVIETAERKGDQIIGTGYLLNTAEADEAASQIEHGVTRPSVDLGSAEWVMTDQDGNEISLDDWWDDNLPEGTRVIDTMTAAKVLGATLVSIPAFAGVSITLTGTAERGGDAEQEAIVAAMVASGERVFDDEFRPRRELFSNPRLTELTPVTYDAATGRVSGHLAPWNKPHIAVGEKAPKSPSGYRYFHTSHLNTDNGPLMVGKLTVGTGHAGLRLGAGPAAEHYDNTGSTWAYVCAGEDAHGIWISGVLHPSAPADRVHDGLASPLSGDWREINGAYELVAGLSVNVPGFPLVAGATKADGSLLSMVAALSPRPARPTEAMMARSVRTNPGRGITAAVGDEGGDGDGGDADTGTDAKFPVGSAVVVSGAKGTVSTVEETTGYEVTFEDDSTAWFVERDVEADTEDADEAPSGEAAVINVGQLAVEVAGAINAMNRRTREAAAVVEGVLAGRRAREAAAIIARAGR